MHSSDISQIRSHPNARTSLLAIFAFGFLASGGSGPWNAVLSYVLNVKNMKKEKVNELQKKS